MGSVVVLLNSDLHIHKSSFPISPSERWSRFKDMRLRIKEGNNRSWRDASERRHNSGRHRRDAPRSDHEERVHPSDGVRPSAGPPRLREGALCRRTAESSLCGGGAGEVGGEKRSREGRRSGAELPGDPSHGEERLDQPGEVLERGPFPADPQAHGEDLQRPGAHLQVVGWRHRLLRDVDA